MKKLKTGTILFCAALILSACSGKNAGEIYDSGLLIHDPYENWNRKVFAFNTSIDNAFIHPIVDGYRTITPRPARTGLQNFLRNLRSPIDLTNQILQLDFKGAHDVLVRTTVNSLLGIGGIFDLAGHEGIEYEYEDFGQTLAVWGFDHGSYFVMPLIGPSSMRDYTGYLTDSAMDPLRWYLFNTNEEHIYYTKFGLNYLSLRDSLKDIQTDLENTSIDYYAALRSIYYQRREALVKDLDTESSIVIEIPDYEDDY